MEALIEVYESDIDRVFISQNVELSSENGGFQKNLKGKVIRISPQVKQRKVLSTDPTGDADSRIVEILVNEGEFVKKGDILAIFENEEKLIADLERNENLISTINEEITLKKDQIQRYELALSKGAYSFVVFKKKR